MRYLCVLPVALIGLFGLQQLGGAGAGAIAGKTTAQASASATSAPTLTSLAEAAGASAMSRVAKLARKAAKGGQRVNVSEAVQDIARQSARVSVHDEVTRRAADLPDELWKPRLIHGLDPHTSWRDLNIAAIDLEGKTGSPTQVGVVLVTLRELSHEVTLRITPNDGEATKKATRIRLLDGSKEVSEAGTFADSQQLFETFVRDRVPLAFSHQGDLQGLMKEWSQIDNPGAAHLYAVEPGVEWLDVEDWARMMSYGDGNKLKEVYARVTGKQLSGAHVGVNDARAAARILYTLAEENPSFPTTYGELIKHQLTWRQHRGDFERLLKERLQTAIDQDVEKLTALYHREYEMARAELSSPKRALNRIKTNIPPPVIDTAARLRFGARAR